MLTLTGVTKRFGHTLALRNLTLTVPAGSITLLLGENGAGKSTVLRLLATLEKPDKGTLSVAGLDPVREGVEARRLIGHVGHAPGLYGDLTAFENLLFHASFHHTPEEAARRARDALAAVGLAERVDDPTEGFSRGMRQRVALARALLHDPRVLLMDEPFTGLDALATAQTVARLRAWRRPDRAALLTTHDLPAGLQVADQAAVLHRGRLVHEGPVTPDDFARLTELLQGGAPE